MPVAASASTGAGDRGVALPETATSRAAPPPAALLCGAPSAATPLAYAEAPAYVIPAAPIAVRPRRFQWGAGLLGGASIPGTQDLKFKHGNAQGEFTDYMFAPHAEGTTEPFVGAFVSMWIGPGRLHDFGVRAEVDHWETDVRAGALVDRASGPVPSEIPPFTTVHQERTAIQASLLRRFSLPGLVPMSEDGPHGYVGLGTGLVYTSVKHGLTGWDLGSQALAGVSLPLSPRIRLLLEGRYIITHDQDFNGLTTYYRVDTSGTRVLPGWAHLDTRFYTFLVGLEFRF